MIHPSGARTVSGPAALRTRPTDGPFDEMIHHHAKIIYLLFARKKRLAFERLRQLMDE